MRGVDESPALEGGLITEPPADRSTASASPPIPIATVSVPTAPPLPAPAEAVPAEVMPAETAPVWLRRGDQLFIGVALILSCLLLTIHWGRLSGWGRQGINVERLPAQTYAYRVDVNRATWVEWMQIEGIGETLARRIVEDREQHGPFTRLEDLDRVKGIGPKTLDRIRPWLVISDDAAEKDRR